MIDEFLISLKTSMEQFSSELHHGALFHPKGLEGKKLTGKVFPKIARNMARELDLGLTEEYTNYMPYPSVYGLNKYSRVDFVFRKGQKPEIFFELESLDRAQLYLFWEYRRMWENENKLWYYYGTVVKYHDLGKIEETPRYFVWLLILPDYKVESYSNWDVNYYRLFHPSIKKLICENPFNFYNPLIKASVRKFVQKKHYFRPSVKKWITKQLTEFQDVCELVFITCTGDRLVMSRGKDLFSSSKEVSLQIDWKGKMR